MMQWTAEVVLVVDDGEPFGWQKKIIKEKLNLDFIYHTPTPLSPL